jgi:formamidopyrimidine-DNA glycosylase
MPELPEVETIRRGLSDRLLGQQLCGVKVFLAKAFVGEAQVVVGKKLANVERMGKLLVLDFGEYLLTVHLRMTGVLLVESKVRQSESMFAISREEALSDGVIGARFCKNVHDTRVAGVISGSSYRHLRVALEFADFWVYFVDQRTFGKMGLVKRGELEKIKFVQSLGVEPLSEKFDFALFVDLMRKCARRNIKASLLDQKVIAGIGNIYADESLFRAGILPMRVAGSLSAEELAKLFEAIRSVLERGVNLGGSSRTHYLNVEGKPGTFLDEAMVYQRGGQRCRLCGGEIEKGKVAGRGTHWCGECQK